MTEGSVTPILAPGWHWHGALLAPIRGTQPLDYAHVYLTLDDYVPAADPQSADRIAGEIVGGLGREDLLLSLINVLYLATRTDRIREAASHFAQALNPEYAERLRGALNPQAADSRQFLSRQGVLAAIKRALQAPAHPTPKSNLPIEVGAVLLVHAVSTLLSTRSGGERDRLMMELIRNFDFNQSRDPARQIADHIEMWETFGGKAVAGLNRTASELVRQFTHLEPRDLLAFGFAVGVNAINYEPGQGLVVQESLPGVRRSNQDIQAFLGAVAATPDELHRRYIATSDGPWNFLPFQSRPVVRLSGGRLVVLDMKMLLDRVTDGLYWDVHDGLRDTEGSEARKAWTRAYGDMVEAFVAARFASLAPPGFDSPSYYSESELKQAYPRSKVSDGLIDVGGTFIPIEVVSGRLSVRSRVHGVIAAFRNDTEMLVMKKVRQLDGISKELLRDEKPLTGRTSVVGRRVQPLLVAGGDYPVEPFSSGYIQEEVARERLFADSRILSVGVVSLEELSMLVGLRENLGVMPHDVLGAWQGSGISNLALRNFLLQTYGNDAGSFRPAYVSQFWEQFEDLAVRLGLDAEDGGEGPSA